MRKSFCEDVGKVGRRVNLVEPKVPRLNKIANEEMTELNVLGVPVKHSILSEVNGTGIVTPDGGTALGGTKFLKKEGEPAGLLRSHGSGIQLRLAGGEGDSRGAGGAPADKAASKREAIALGGVSIRPRISPGGVTVAAEERWEGATKGKDIFLGATKVPEDTLGGLPVLFRMFACANKTSEDADGVGKVRARGDHGVHEGADELGIRMGGG
ncbi:unnamed protein product [Closterium sp. NIES-54]